MTVIKGVSSVEGFVVRRRQLERQMEDILIAMMEEKTPDGLAILGHSTTKLIEEFNTSLDVLYETHKNYVKGKARLVPVPEEKDGITKDQ